MGKITFRADDELVAELEAFDASKSEVMREALRAYLDGKADRYDRDGYKRDSRTRDRRPSSGSDPNRGGTIDDVLCERIDALLEERLAERMPSRGQQDVNVTVALEGAPHAVEQSSVERKTADPETERPARKTPTEQTRACDQCGSSLEGDHVFCPNCGEKASHRLFCECGDEVRSDWAFCPSCGRRTPAADVLDSNQSRVSHNRD